MCWGVAKPLLCAFRTGFCVRVELQHEFIFFRSAGFFSFLGGARVGNSREFLQILMTQIHDSTIRRDSDHEYLKVKASN